MGGLETLGEAARDVVAWLARPEPATVLTWLLAAVFAWSGAVKVARPTRAALALLDFGLVRRVRPRLGLAAGGFELGLAALLVAGFASDALVPVGAGAAAATLALFAALIARGLARGERFACFCFGDASEPLSWRTLARAVALGVAACFVAVASPALAGQAAGAVALGAVVAASCGGLLVIAALCRRLVRWNRDPFGLGDDLWIARAGDV